MYRTFIFVLFASALLAQNPQPPQALTVVAATATQVDLRWTAASGDGYSVERKALDGSYATVLTGTTGSTASDKNIDPYTTYVYRVRATAGQTSSDPSNEVTVGPPPFGYNTVVKTPDGLRDVGDFGARVRMILDVNGDPALAYLWLEPNNDGDFTKSALYFVRWDRAHYQWTAPVKVAVVGDVERGTLAPVSIARDSSNSMFGIAFEDESKVETSQIGIALSSDAGQTWKLQAVTSPDGSASFQRPSLAMAAGNVHLAFFHDVDGYRYVTGKETDNPTTWRSTLIPTLPGYDGPTRRISLALDSKGNPGVAFTLNGDNGPAEAFWRPGGNAVLIADDAGHQNDDPDIRLAFFGTQPRVVFAGAMDDLFFEDYDHGLWVIASPNDGTTWAKAVNVRSDGNRTLNGPLDIAINSKGQVALVSEDNSGNLDGVNCGEPKLSMSSDLLNWKTCGPSTLGAPILEAYSPNVAFGGNDRLFLAFQQTDQSDGALPLGVIVWRQPPDWTFPPPPPPRE